MKIKFLLTILISFLAIAISNAQTIQTNSNFPDYNYVCGINFSQLPDWRKGDRTTPNPNINSGSDSASGIGILKEFLRNYLNYEKEDYSQTNYFGAQTEENLKRFQLLEGIPVTGVFDFQTKKNIQQICSRMSNINKYVSIDETTVKEVNTLVSLSGKTNLEKIYIIFMDENYNGTTTFGSIVRNNFESPARQTIVPNVYNSVDQNVKLWNFMLDNSQYDNAPRHKLQGKFKMLVYDYTPGNIESIARYQPILVTNVDFVSSNQNKKNISVSLNKVNSLSRNYLNANESIENLATFNFRSELNIPESVIQEMVFAPNAGIESVSVNGLTATVINGRAVVSGLRIKVSGDNMGTNIPVGVKVSCVGSITTDGCSFGGGQVVLPLIQVKYFDGSKIQTLDLKGVSSNEYYLLSSESSTLSSIKSPIISLTSDKSNVMPGEMINVKWSANNATRCWMQHGPQSGNDIEIPSIPTSSQKEFKLSENYRVSVGCANEVYAPIDGPQEKKTVYVKVGSTSAASSISTSTGTVSPTLINLTAIRNGKTLASQTITAKWSTKGLSKCLLTAPGVSNAVNASGSKTFKPKSTKTSIKLSCYNSASKIISKTITK